MLSKFPLRGMHHSLTNAHVPGLRQTCVQVLGPSAQVES